MTPKKSNKRAWDTLVLQARLAPITKAQWKWAEGRTMNYLRNEYCENGMQKKVKGRYDYTIVTRSHDWLVVRHILVVAQYCNRTGFKVLREQEIQQSWWQNGDLEVFQVQKMAFWYNMLVPYTHNDPVWFGCGSSYQRNRIDRLCVNREDIYPIRRYTENEKRLAYLYECEDCLLVHDFFRHAEPATLAHIETLCKSGKADGLIHDTLNLVANLDTEQRTPTIDRYWRSYLIAQRNGYTPADWNMWLEMLDDLSLLHLDTHSPKYICPQDLTKAHQHYIEKSQPIKDRIRMEEIKDQTQRENVEYQKRVGKWLSVTISNENLDIKPLQSVMEFYAEGKAMHHCVYNAGYYKASKNCLILSAKDKKGKRVETIEIGLDNFKIRQSRAKCNGVSKYHDEIAELIRQNVNLLKYPDRKPRRSARKTTSSKIVRAVL